MIKIIALTADGSTLRLNPFNSKYTRSICTNMETSQDTGAFPKGMPSNVQATSKENQFVPATEFNEDDVDFGASFDNQDNNKAYSLFKENGIMNFTKMIKDGVLNIHKAENGTPLELD